MKEVVASGLTKKKGLFKTLNNKDKEDIDYALKRVEMTDYLHRNIGSSLVANNNAFLLHVR